MMFGRDQDLNTAASLVQAGESVDIVGSRGSGRSSFLAKLRNRLEAEDFTVVSVRGVASLRQHPLAAMHLAGVGGQRDPRTSTIQLTADALREMTLGQKSVLFMDDWDDLDESSWGLAESIRRSTGLPIVLSRLQGLPARHTPSGLAASSLETSYVIDMLPIRFEELELVLIDRLGGPIETGTMSRIYAKSGGIVGLACSILDAAVREERLVNNSGMWSATRDLWSPGLRGVLEAHLENLTPEARDALEVIALVGVADVDTVRKLVSWNTLELLEERGMLRLIPAGSRQLVNVVPPLLVEFFRNLPLAARRIRLSEMITRRLGASDSVDLLVAQAGHVEAIAEDDALFVRLLQERARTRRIVTRAEWESAPEPRTAVQYIRALLQTSGSEPQVLAVFDAAIEVGGDTISRIEFALLRAQWGAYIEGDMSGALHALRDETSGLGPHSRMAEAGAVLIESNLEAIPPDFADRLESGEELPEQVRCALLEAQLTVLISLGRFGDARRVFDSLPDSVKNSSATPANALFGFVLLGEGEFDEALQWALRGIDEAHGFLDPEATRSHGYLAALCLLISGDYAATEEITDMLFSMGDPPLFPMSLQLGLLSIASIAAIRRGNIALGERYVQKIAAAGIVDGPLPLQSTVWTEAQLLALNGQSREAADGLWAAAEVHWARGARFAAGLAMLTAVELQPGTERFAVLDARIGKLDCPYLAPHLEYLRARECRDPQAFFDVTDGLVRTGRPGLAVGALRQAIELFQQNRQDAFADVARSRLESLNEELGNRPIDTIRFNVNAITLTARELEISQMIAQGLSNPEIASRLVLSVRTVESHLNKIMRKTRLSARAELVAYMNSLPVNL